MKRAITFHRAFRTGAGTPLLVTADDDRRYVVKLPGSGEGPTSLIVEWLGLELGRAFGLPVLEPHLIKVGSDFVAQILDTEVRELAGRSQACGLACRYLEAAHPSRPLDLAFLDGEIRQRIFLWDLLCLNIDRTEENLNALTANRKIWFVDYSASLEFRRILGLPVPSETRALEVLRGHPFYDPHPDETSFQRLVDVLRMEDVARILAGVPDGWLPTSGDPERTRESLRTGLGSLWDAAAEKLSARLTTLRRLTPENAEARQARIAKNRIGFLDRFPIR